jgi:hypothetical protein
MEDGSIKELLEGTPQGAVISPFLANIYLHYAFDVWAQQWRKRHLQGRMIAVRYADDILLGLSHEQDARTFVAALTERMAVFALALHPAKMRIVEFGRHAIKNRKMLGLSKPESFNYLGFTHICAVDRHGRFQLRRHSRRDRLRATLARIKLQLKRRMHWSIPEQGHWLARVVRGWFGYHAVPTNFRALNAFRNYVVDLWRRALNRRSQKGNTTWSRMTRIANDFLPPARISHPWPSVRFAANYPRWEPGASITLAGICAGARREGVPAAISTLRPGAGVVESRAVFAQRGRVVSGSCIDQNNGLHAPVTASLGDRGDADGISARIPTACSSHWVVMSWIGSLVAYRAHDRRLDVMGMVFSSAGRPCRVRRAIRWP